MERSIMERSIMEHSMMTNKRTTLARGQAKAGLLVSIAACVMLSLTATAADDPARWSSERANTWYAAQDWPVGFNYIPRYAINQLEMWQADTFNPEIIDQELGWAADIGFNTTRVFLHNLLWTHDRDAFVKRIDQYLTIAASHNIKTIFVLFDDVWDPRPTMGQQHQPIPHTHNSGWLQAPGKDILGTLSRHDELRDYVEGIVGRYRSDPRVLFWDMYNEPGNPNASSYGHAELPGKSHFSLQLIKKVFVWARAVGPEQPISSGVWQFDFQHQHWLRNELFRFMTSSSDIITFHSYVGPDGVDLSLAYLQENYQRPIICTEYMARGTGNRFQTIVPIFVRENIGAINWGLVSGKSQTIYPWSSWTETFFQEPDLWHHDILRADGSPYSAAEVEFLRKIIANKMATRQ